MIRVFFNIRLDDTYLPERTGQLIDGEPEARELARVIVRRLVADHGGEPRLLDAALVVTDVTGAVLFDLSFFEALYVPVAAPEPAGQPLRRVEMIALRAQGALSGKVALRAQSALSGKVAKVAMLAGALPVRRRAEPPDRYRLGFEPGA